MKSSMLLHHSSNVYKKEVSDLFPGEIDIHLLWFDSGASHPWEQELHAFLSDRERQACQSMGSSHRWKEYLLSRVLTRSCLSAYTGIEIRELEFVREPHGKPGLKNPSVQFNLSHTEGLIALSVSRHSVGIDLENTDLVKMRRNWPLVAERYFSPAERDYLGCQPAELQPLHFFRIFTLKEATLKTRGRGWGGSGVDFTVPYELGERSRSGSLEFFSNNLKDNSYCLAHVVDLTSDRDIPSIAGNGLGVNHPETFYKIREWNEDTLAEGLLSQAAVRD